MLVSHGGRKFKCSARGMSAKQFLQNQDSAAPSSTNRLAQVTSWDEDTNSPDMAYGSGRSYISAVSEVITDTSETCAGHAKNNMGEARMDIEMSEIAYLGYAASESYGLTWKVSLLFAILMIGEVPASTRDGIGAQLPTNHGGPRSSSCCLLDQSVLFPGTFMRFQGCSCWRRTQPLKSPTRRRP